MVARKCWSSSSSCSILVSYLWREDDRCGLHHTELGPGAASQHTPLAGSGYSGQTLWNWGVRMGSCQASVLVKMNIQRAGVLGRCWAPRALWEKRLLVPLTSPRPARVGEGPLKPYCLTDEQSVAPTCPTDHLCSTESHFISCSPLMPAMLPVRSPTSFPLFILGWGSKSHLSRTCHTVHTCHRWSK